MPFALAAALPARFRRVRPAVRRGRAACALLLAALGAGAVHAESGTAVWRIDDAPGEIHLSDQPDAPAGASAQCVAGPGCAAPAPARAPAAAAPRYDELVRQAATRQGVAPALIHAVIAVESAYRPRALSPRGAAGLMQLMPATAARYGVTDVFDPAQNIAAGARHLRALLDRYGQDPARALAAYNAGPAVAHWSNAETAAYVPAVLARYAAAQSPKTTP